jgi:hypothetical protein
VFRLRTRTRGTASTFSLGLRAILNRSQLRREYVMLHGELPAVLAQIGQVHQLSLQHRQPRQVRLWQTLGAPTPLPQK